MSFIVTMTPSIEGHKITRYIGPVIIPTIGAGSMLKDWFAGFTDILGGKSGAYKKVYAQFINDGVQEMISQAKEHGANAIINYRIVTENIDVNQKSMISIVNYGTAVMIEKVKEECCQTESFQIEEEKA